MKGDCTGRKSGRGKEGCTASQGEESKVTQDGHGPGNPRRGIAQHDGDTVVRDGREMQAELQWELSLLRTSH